MFTIKDIQPHLNKIVTINNEQFIIKQVEEMAGTLILWDNDKYKIYATPQCENISIPIQIIYNNVTIYTTSYYEEINSFEEYIDTVINICKEYIK